MLMNRRKLLGRVYNLVYVYVGFGGFLQQRCAVAMGCCRGLGPAHSPVQCGGAAHASLWPLMCCFLLAAVLLPSCFVNRTLGDLPSPWQSSCFVLPTLFSQKCDPERRGGPSHRTPECCRAASQSVCVWPSVQSVPRCGQESRLWRGFLPALCAAVLMELSQRCPPPTLRPTVQVQPGAVWVTEPSWGHPCATSTTGGTSGPGCLSRNLRRLQQASEGVRNALQADFLSVIVSNSPLAVPASQVSVCFKLFSPEASAAFFQIESHLFSTQVSNLSGALCVISQSALLRTIYPHLVSSVNYINVPFSSSCT